MAFNIYEEITNRIIAQLEKGVIPWRKTWNGSEPIGGWWESLPFFCFEL